jgi:hypothetical protein
MNKIKYIILLLFATVIAFAGGLYFHKYNSLEAPKYKLIEPLKLQAELNEVGTLPKGTILYEYEHGPSIDTFIVFVNTKNLSSLEPIQFEHKFTVSPIDAYKE